MTLRTPPTRRNILQLAGGAAAVVALADTPGSTLAADLPAGAVTAVTFIHGLSGDERELREHLLSLAAPTRAEAGCLTYDLYESPDQPQEFMRLEVWASEAAFAAHKAAPHLRASVARRQREGWTTEILTWRRVAADVA